MYAIIEPCDSNASFKKKKMSIITGASAILLVKKVLTLKLLFLSYIFYLPTSAHNLLWYENNQHVTENDRDSRAVENPFSLKK